MPYGTLTAELAGQLPGLSPFLAGSFIARAWRDIRNARRWAFLLAESAIICPPQVTAGTVAVTQYAAAFTFDATATAALAALPATPGLLACQLRVQGGQLYNLLTAAGSPLTGTLDRIYLGASGAALPYAVYRAYVTPPAADFVGFTALTDYENGYTLTGHRLTRTRAEIDRRDPQRQATDLAYVLGSYQASSDGSPIYELWPHPTSGQAFNAQYRRRGVDFSAPSDTQPASIPDALILSRALAWYAYPWVQANRGAFPRYAKTDLLPLISAARAQYLADFRDVARQDDDQVLQSVIDRGHRGGSRRELPGPADARYWQSHAISW